MVSIQTNIEATKWDELSKRSSYTTLFQTKKCYDFYCSLSFLEPFVYGVERSGDLKGLICGYIIANGGQLKRYFSRRAIIHGGALLDADITDDELSLLLQTVTKELSKKAIYIEVRNNHDYSVYKSVFNRNDFQYKPHYNYIISTSENISTINSKISESKIRQIRKAKNDGVEFLEANTQQEIDDFYYILEKLYRDKIKKPLFPKVFFEKLLRFSFGKLFVVKYKGKTIGGMLCAILDKTTIYEWFVCGEDKQYKHQYPSILATYGTIEYSVKNGFSYFDFMGAGSPTQGYGVREFKKKFGGELVEWGRFLYVNSKIRYRIGKIIISIRSHV